jgi:hypothetical protein
MCQILPGGDHQYLDGSFEQMKYSILVLAFSLIVIAACTTTTIEIKPNLTLENFTCPAMECPACQVCPVQECKVCQTCRNESINQSIDLKLIRELKGCEYQLSLMNYSIDHADCMEQLNETQTKLEQIKEVID